MKLKYCVMVFCFLLLTAIPALATLKDFAYYTVEIPAQWQVEQSGRFWEIFMMPKNSGSVNIVRREFRYPDANLLVRNAAAASEADKIHMLPDGQGFLFTSSNGSRIWLMESGGQMIRIEVQKPHQDLPNLLRSFKSEHTGVAKIFAALTRSPNIIAWLSFASNEPAASLLPASKELGMPDFVLYGTIEGEKGSPPPLTGEVPVGWTHKTIGCWTVIIANNGKEWCATRFFPLASGTLGDLTLEEIEKEVVVRLKGRNLVGEEGSLHFDTPFGSAGLNLMDESKVQVILTKGDEAPWYILE